MRSLKLNKVLKLIAIPILVLPLLGLAPAIPEKTTQKHASVHYVQKTKNTDDKIANEKKWIDTVNKNTLNKAILKNELDKQSWIATVKHNEAVRAAQIQAKKRMSVKKVYKQPVYAQSHASGRFVDGIEVCNGTTLPSCYIVNRESRFNPRAENPVSSASGLYQFIDSTWANCHTGYSHASYAPVSVQVSCARYIWSIAPSAWG